MMQGLADMQSEQDGDPVKLVQQGVAYAGNNNPQDALHCFDKALAFPTSAWPHPTVKARAFHNKALA